MKRYQPSNSDDNHSSNINSTQSGNYGPCGMPYIAVLHHGPPHSRGLVLIMTLAFKFQRNKIVLLRSLVMIQYYGEPPRPRGSVLVLKLPGLEYWILFQVGSIISFISSPSGGPPGPVYPNCAKSLIYFISFSNRASDVMTNFKWMGTTANIRDSMPKYRRIICFEG